MRDIGVLIMDDEPGAASVYMSIVEAVGGFRVAGAVPADGEALALIADRRADLVIFGGNLADRGYEVINLVRANGLAVDFVVVSAASDGPSVSRALRMGVIDYILKPFRPERLAAFLLSYRRFIGE